MIKKNAVKTEAQETENKVRPIGDYPINGDKVFVNFTTFDGHRTKVKPLQDYDKIDAVYSDAPILKPGKSTAKLFSVRLASGDLFAVFNSGKGYWQTVA